MCDNTIRTDHCALYCSAAIDDDEVLYLKKNFCGFVVETLNDLASDITVYLCGRIDLIRDQLTTRKNYYVIEELSQGYTDDDHLVTLGMVPLNIHNQGVFFRQVFDLSKDYFHLLAQAHQFQSLTESSKPNFAMRKGIYLCDVTGDPSEGLQYHLLRCSSNLAGPTDNFRDIDHEIITTVTNLCQPLFHQPIAFNHVLAQIYFNDDGKAKLKAHSDKTKDMPAHALIAFTTFYDRSCSASKSDRFDQCYHNTSVLTTLRFKLKPDVNNTALIEKFTVVLYPGSVFVIPLSTNRWYTHEIKPSVLPADKIPVRLGYVIRCSNTQAKFKNGTCVIVDESGEHPLEPCTGEKVSFLRGLYYQENTTSEVVKYPPTYFSMNSGDYLAPLI